MDELEHQLAIVKQGSLSCAEAIERHQEALEDLKCKDLELQNSKQLRTQLEHAYRCSERNIEKLKIRLLEKVTRERRRAQRDGQVYERIRQAYTVSKNNPTTRAGSGITALIQLLALECNKGSADVSMYFQIFDFFIRNSDMHHT